MPGPAGKIAHCEFMIGDSRVMLGDISMNPDPTPVPGLLHVYVEDVDKVYVRALEAGATSTRPPEDMFYGDRTAQVEDVGGNKWYLATHIEDVPPEEMEKRAKQQMGQ